MRKKRTRSFTFRFRSSRPGLARECLREEGAMPYNHKQPYAVQGTDIEIPLDWLAFFSDSPPSFDTIQDQTKKGPIGTTGWGYGAPL